MQQLWFSLYDRERYTGNEPSFFDPQTTEWAGRIAKDTSIIKAELLSFLERSDLITYFNSTMTQKGHTWKTISMKWWGLEVYRHQRYFPETTKLINSVPDCVSASFNMLDAQSEIKPHNGDTNGIYRCHLGLIIPASLPESGFRVEQESRSWKEGEWLIFVDALHHEAWNRCNGKRYILVLDIIRPEFRNQKGKICSTVLTGLFMQKLGEKIPILYKLPIGAQRFIAVCIRPLSYPAKWLRNAASKIKLVD